MTTQQLLGIMRLLSAMESSLIQAKALLPAQLSKQLEDCVTSIEDEILRRTQKEEAP